MRRLATLFLVLVSCTTGSTTSTTSPAVVSTTTSTAPAGTATITVPTSTTTTFPLRPELSEPQIIYLYIDAAVGPPRLIPLWRDASSPQGVAGAIETLLAGPTPEERLGTPAIATTIPPGVQLHGVTVVNELATVDLSSEFFDTGPEPEAIAQVVYTATRFDTVDSVAFRHNGEPFPGLPGGADRTAFRDLQAPLFLEEPTYGGPAAQPGRLRGEARVAAGEFSVTMLDSEGVVIADLAVEVLGPGWIEFDVPLPYFVDISQEGVLVAATADGVAELQVPLQLQLPPTDTCSAAGFSAEAPEQDVSNAAAAKRQAIIDTAVACDFEGLAALGAPGFVFDFASGGSAAEFWRSQEAVGIPVTRLMVQLLKTPPVLDTDFVVPTYLWPSAFRAAPAAADFDLLEGIIPPEDLALYRQFNEYLDLRIGIDDNGSWDFAVAGD